MITIPSKQILLTSLNKAVNISKISGKLDLSIIAIYNLYIHYIDFTEGKEEFNDINRCLKEKISSLKYKYPNILCNYKLKNTNININNRDDNTAPEVDDNIIDLEGEYTYNFKIEDFTKNYTDLENDPYHSVIIYPPTILGQDEPVLYYVNNNNQFTINTTQSNTNNLEPIINTKEILLKDIHNLKYIYNSGIVTTIINKNEVDYNLNFRVSDISEYGSLYSERANLNIINTSYIENEPAVIGDISVISDNREETILTLDMFTNQMQPPYSDPENDLIDAIRIDSISQANEGIFYYDNVAIQVGDIITREDLENDLFKHIGPNVDSLAGDSIEFSARDEGSQIWVQ